MLDRARTIALACAALVSTGCPSLDALECHGASCSDAAPGDASSGDGAFDTGASAEAGIYCGAGTYCSPPGSTECCMNDDGGTACTSTNSCPGTDVFCDDPSQCPGGTPCWICINAQGFQGTSCDYQGDIVHNDNCNASNARQMCHSDSQCDGGTTCKPLPLPGPGPNWFQACQ